MKKPRRAREANQPVAAEHGEKLVAAERAFFKGVINDVITLIADNAVLLNIPIWGYPNHGKTTAILTALQACAPDLHGIALAIVNDSDDLLAFEEQQELYRALGLPSLASATRETLSDLLEQFHSRYPDATELPSQYLLELQATPGRLGYVLLPDIKGGSYESVDDVARNAMANAHAMVMVIDPEFYYSDNASALNYRKEVLRLVQRSSQAGLPTCIMITMADKYGNAGDFADRTEKELAGRIAQQTRSEVFKLLRVSAVGPVNGAAADGLPPPEKRDPRKLVEAWTWTLHQALKRPRAEVLGAIPRTDLHVVRRPKDLETTTQPELRRVGTPLDSPGDVIASSGDGSHDRFLLLGPHKLFEISIDGQTGNFSVCSEVELNTDSDMEGLVAHSLDGALFIGSRHAAQVIWHGIRGQALSRIVLNTPLHCWFPVGTRRLVGLAPNGTLYCLHLQDDACTILHHLSEFINVSPNIVCSFQKGNGLVVAADGAGAVRAVTLNQRGHFAEKRTVSIAVRYNSEDAEMNHAGYLTARTGDNSVVAGREAQLALGPCHPEWMPVMALAPIAPVVAWITPECLLRAARIDGKKPVVTADSNSPLLADELTGIAWNEAGSGLLLSDENGKLAWIRRYGF